MRYVTIGSLIGLAAGAAAGALLQHLGSVDPWRQAAEMVGTLWVNGLRMTIIPLVVSLIITAVASHSDGARVGRMGTVSLAVFVAMLAAAAALTLAFVLPLLGDYHVAPEVAASLRSSLSGNVPAVPPPSSMVDWVVNLVPTNPFRAAADGAFLPLILFTLLFALAAARTPAATRQVLVAFFRAVADAMFVLVRWLLLGMPVGVFALALVFAAGSGLALVGAVGFYLVIVCSMMLLCTLLMYVMAVLLGRVSLRRFVMAVAPAQLVGVSSRSSIASLPALLDGAENSLGMDAEVSGFVLPLAVSTFKLNTTISSTVKLLFLAAVFGIPLTAVQIATFVATVILLGFASPGIPSGATMTRLPAYLAMGIPIEGYLLMQAVDALPDIFKTLLNVTANLTAATVVSRLLGVPIQTAQPSRTGPLEAAPTPESQP